MYNFKVVQYKFYKLTVIGILLFCAAFSASSQSNDQNFPTPVNSNQLDGTIKARDIGDSRLTTYFFTFDGGQGDIFINVVTNNLNGDIDIFAADGLRPLTKIVLYADSTDYETGRVIYLRKPEKILMRIQGRSPNDDPATFKIKFAGSFAASSEIETDNMPKMPEVKKENDSGVIVNSVGTIISVKPKPTPEPKETVAEKVKDKETAEETVAENNEEEKNEKPQVIVTENENPPEETVSNNEKYKSKKTKTLEINNEPKTETAKTKKEKVTKTREKTKKETEPNPLENIRLVVLLKDGGKIERPMSEVIKFGVEKGILTIINKDGTIARYSILDVEKVTIE